MLQDKYDDGRNSEQNRRPANVPQRVAALLAKFNFGRAIHTLANHLERLYGYGECGQSSKAAVLDHEAARQPRMHANQRELQKGQTGNGCGREPLICANRH
jgi:hypothetical protein